MREQEPQVLVRRHYLFDAMEAARLKAKELLGIEPEGRVSSWYKGGKGWTFHVGKDQQVVDVMVLKYHVISEEYARGIKLPMDKFLVRDTKPAEEYETPGDAYCANREDLQRLEES
jgi:hypothetical protein